MKKVTFLIGFLFLITLVVLAGVAHAAKTGINQGLFPPDNPKIAVIEGEDGEMYFMGGDLANLEMEDTIVWDDATGEIIEIKDGDDMAVQKAREAARLIFKLPKPGLTPDNLFYFLKRLFEEIREFFTFSSEAKLKLQTEFALQRVAEIKALLEAERPPIGHVDHGKTTLKRLKNHIEKANRIIEKEKQKGKDVEDLERHFAVQLETVGAIVNHTIETQTDHLLSTLGQEKVEELRRAVGAIEIAPPAPLSIDEIILNTGFNQNTGVLLADGTPDDDWELVDWQPPTVGPAGICDPPRSPPAVPSFATVVQQLGYSQGWGNPLPDSRWLSTDQYGRVRVLYGEEFTYRYTFNLPEIPPNLSLNLAIMVDQEADVLLNGNLIGSVPFWQSANNPGPISMITSDYFLLGTNMLEVAVRETYHPCGVVTGFDLAGSIKQVPLPSSPIRVPAHLEPICTQDIWECTAWSMCSPAGLQTRTCTLAADCPAVETPKPAESQTCTPPILEPIIEREPAVPACAQSGQSCGPSISCCGGLECTVAGICQTPAPACTGQGQPCGGGLPACCSALICTPSQGALWCLPPPPPPPSQQPTDLKLEKFLNSALHYSGQGSFSIVVENVGSGTATSPITITDELPPGLTYVSFSDPYSTSWSCTASGQKVTCVYNGTDISPGGFLPALIINVSIASTSDFPSITGDQVENCARVEYPNDTDTGNDQGCVTAIITQ